MPTFSGDGDITPWSLRQKQSFFGIDGFDWTNSSCNDIKQDEKSVLWRVFKTSFKVVSAYRFK